MTRFDAPGFLDDLTEAQAEMWSDWISEQMDAVAAGEPQFYDFDAPRPRFFNPLTTQPAADAVEKDIKWNAFPRVVKIEAGSDDERWEMTDGSRDLQDEYCEWSVTRDAATGKITQVTFTSEGPEYWQFLAAVNMPLVLSLYRKHVSPDVKAAHLVDSQGRYNPRNRWNNSTTRGAMHLIQRANSLSAEIELAAGASNVRRKGGVILTDTRELIECGQYGAVERNSDPHIGAEVNALARLDAAITLANPVGLCIASLDTPGWQTPDGSDPQSFWKITRGRPTHALRAVYEVPAGAGFTVGDITINGRPIEFGAQIADFITIKLTGLACRIGQLQVPTVDGCKRPRQGAGLNVPTVASLLKSGSARSTR